MTLRDLPQRLTMPAPMGSLLKHPGMVRRRTQWTTVASNPAHLACVRDLPCIRCGQEPCHEAAHIRQNSAAMGKRQALGAKPSDCWVVSLCASCHRHDPDALHKVGESNFFDAMGINPLLLCVRLYLASGDMPAMRAIVLTAIAERGG